ncbi:MAG: ATP-binding protein [Promethearchaeota archaeon]
MSSHELSKGDRFRVPSRKDLPGLWKWIELGWLTSISILTLYFIVVYLLPLLGLITPVSIPSKLFIEVIISIGPVLMGVLVARRKLAFEQSLTAVLDDDLVAMNIGNHIVATCCLDIMSAPGSVHISRNDRPEYATAFLLALRAGMNEKVSMAYEVGVWRGEAFLRIFITGIGKSKEEVGNILRHEATRAEAILISSLNNVELHQLRGESLRDAVSGILSLDLEGNSSRELHTVLLLINGEPRVAPSLESSQIGTFLSVSLRQGYDVSLTCVFSKAKPGREQRKLEGQWKTIREKEKRNEDSLADHSEKKKLLRDYEEIQENTGWFDSSVSLAVRTDDSEHLSSIQEAVCGVVHSIWGGDGKVKLKPKAIGKNVAYRLLLRRHITSQRTHVSRLAAFLNTPVQQLPVIAASPVPAFTIPSRKLVNNEFVIGKAVFGGRRINDVGLKPEWLREHVAVLGATGTGKTTLVKHLIAELSKKSSVPWWIFDVKGSEYQELVNLCDDDILVLKPGVDPSFVIDFMDPETDSGEKHAHTTFAILKELLNERGVSSELSPAMEKLLREAVLEVAHASSNDNSIQALIREISDLAGKDRTAIMTRDALLNRLEILSREPLGTILSGGRNAVRISNLMDKRVILDLQYVARTGGMDAARLLYNLIAKRIFDYALHRGIKPGLHHLVVLEEASNLVPESYTRHTAADVTTGESMVMLQRATGQGVVVISTRPNVSSNILANTATKIAFRLPYDSPIGARFMSLDDEQERYLKTLKRGRALIVLPGTEPFEIATRPFEMASILERPPLEPSIHDEREIPESKDASIEHDTTIQSGSFDSSSKPMGAVYDRLGELGSHIVAFLASRNMATQAEMEEILTAIDPRMESSDINEVIRDLVSLGTIEREALPIVPGDFIFTLPGRGLDAVSMMITDYIIEKLGLHDVTWERNLDDRPDIVLDDRAILILPQHLKASSMKTTVNKIRNYMNNLGNDFIELVVVVRGSVAAAKLRETMSETNEFDAVSIVSAFPSSLDAMIENLAMGTSTNVGLTTSEHKTRADAGVNLIGAMHGVGTATNRAIQMRLWFQLIQDFVDLSNGRTEWNVLLEFIETTALQSLRGKTTPMNIEEGKRALTELLADEVLMALRVGNDLDFIDLEEGLWIVNSGELGKLKDSAVDALEKELRKRQNSVSRDHGYYDLCTNGVSYVVFPNQQQLNTLLHLQSDIACRTCKSRRIVCVLTAAEYLEETMVMPDNVLLYDFSEYVSVASAAGQ